MAIPRWKLPFDVVSNVMMLASPAGIASTMETCRSLYSEGPRHLLRNGVTLRTPRQITSFTSFMFAEGTVRFGHLRELNLGVGDLEHPLFVVDDCSVAADVLIDLLQCPALSLHTLRLGRAEGLLSLSCAIRDAFRTLTTLKHLAVCHVGTATIATVGRMSSKLVSAMVDHIDPTLDFMTSSDQVLAMLAPFSDTLEEVSLALDCPFNFERMPTDICFPRVRSLTILSDSCRFLPSCLHAFSNVQSIQHNPSRMPPRSTICQSNIAYFVNSLDAARQWNAGFRLEALTECSSDLLSLCILSPDLVAVQKLRISTQLHDVMVLALLPEVLTAARPSELEMCVAGLDTLEGVTSLLVAHALQTLHTLRINFSFREEDHDGSSDDLAAALQRLITVVDDFPAEVPSFDLILDLASCFGSAASYLDDEDVHAFRNHLTTSSSHVSCNRRIIPVRPVDVASDPEMECGEDSDVDSDAWSDQTEWGSASDSDKEDSFWFEDEDEVEKGIA